MPDVGTRKGDQAKDLRRIVDMQRRPAGRLTGLRSLAVLSENLESLRSGDEPGMIHGLGGVGGDIAEGGSPFVDSTVHIPVDAVAEGIVVRIGGLGGEGVRRRGVAGDRA